MKSISSAKVLCVFFIVLCSLLLGSCEILEALFDTNEAPTVTLTADTSSVAVGDIVNVEADASDPDGDSLTYTWYLDDELQTEATEPEVTWTATAGDHTIKVKVSDGEESAEDSLTISVQSAPTVTLSADDSTAYSDQTVTFTATASDPDDDTLTYAWYWNDTLQTGATGSSVSWYWLRSANSTEKVKVVVSDGNGGSDEAEVTVTITAGSSLRIDNEDTVSYDEFYTSTSYTSWGSDLYYGTLVPGNRLTIYNLGTVYLYYKAVDINNLYWDTYTNNSSGYNTSNGYYRTWTLYAGSCPVTAQSNVVSSVAPPAGSADTVVPRVLPPSKSEEAGLLEAGEATAEFSVTAIPKSERLLGFMDGGSLYSVEY